MSVDYYNCPKCGIIFNDNAYDFQFCDHCHKVFCSPDCSGIEPVQNDDRQDVEVRPPCCICRCSFDDLSDACAFPILLDVFGMSRQTAIELIRGHLAQDGKKR